MYPTTSHEHACSEVQKVYPNPEDNTVLLVRICTGDDGRCGRQNTTTNKKRGDVRLPTVSRTVGILIFIMIPSIGGDIVLRAPALGPIMVASTTHNSGLWVVA